MHVSDTHGQAASAAPASKDSGEDEDDAARAVGVQRATGSGLVEADVCGAAWRCVLHSMQSAHATARLAAVCCALRATAHQHAHDECARIMASLGVSFVPSINGAPCAWLRRLEAIAAAAGVSTLSAAGTWAPELRGRKTVFRPRKRMSSYFLLE